MKKIAIVLLLLSPLFTLAQKVDVQNDKITVDGAEYAGITKDGCGFLQATCVFTVTNKANKPVLIVKGYGYTARTTRTASNPEGKEVISWLEFVFLESKQKAEVEFMLKTGSVAKLIVKSKLFKNGELDNEAVENFVLINGKHFSEEKGTRIVIN